MALNQLYIPKISPVKFYRRDQQQLPQYLSRHFDEWMLQNQIEDYERPVFYNQKWQQSDVIYFQFQANFASIQIKIIDCGQHQVGIVYPATKIKANRFLPGYYIFEAAISLANIPEGTFWLQMTLGGTTVMISEPIQVARVHADTMLFEYANSRYFGDVFFETGIKFMMRIEAKFEKLQPGNQKTSYTDQQYNPSVLKAIPYNSRVIIFGKDGGVPDWVGEKINWIFSCDNVFIDGHPYAALSDSTLESGDIDSRYRMHPYTLKVQDGVNRASITVGVEVDNSDRLVLILSQDDTIFGDLSNQAGNNIIQITDSD